MTIDRSSVVPTMSTLSRDEYEQMGRNSVDQTEASFIALLLDLTNSADAIESAMRGRRSALAETEATS